VSEHIPPDDLAGFVSRTLSRRKSRQLVRHLLRGCSSCAQSLASYGGFSSVALPEDAYDTVVSRATARVRRAVDPQREGLAMLTSLLAGERSWRELSGPDLATLRGLPQVKALIEAGRSLRHHDSQATLRFARLARFASDRLNPQELGSKAVADVRALTWAELGNAYRICDDLPRANQAMNRAIYWSHRGSRTSLLLARVSDLLASLLAYQRRFPEAREVLALVYNLHLLEGREHLAGRALISAGHFASSEGTPAAAIILMRRGLALLDSDRDPALEAQALRGMIWLLTDLGRFRTARRLLWQSRYLFVEHGNAFDLLRLRWLEARIYAGLSDFDRAEAAFQEARSGFAEHGQVYTAALAGLDLAALWARQGRSGEIHHLAHEMIATFRALRIAREAIVTLLILQRACLSGGGQLMEIIEMAVTFLRDLDRQPAKRSESNSASL
jgi:tetratricopeptide (TPR) repeat protein